MGQKQLVIRVAENLLQKLDNYAVLMKTSKTEIVIGALAQYLDSPESVPLGERVRAVESFLWSNRSSTKGYRN